MRKRGSALNTRGSIIHAYSLDMDHPEDEVQALLESSLGEEEFREVTLPMGQTLWDNDAVQNILLYLQHGTYPRNMLNANSSNC